MITTEELVLETILPGESKNFKLATVVELFENKTAKIQFDGEDVPSEKQYAYLNSYTPVIDDKILLGVLSGTYIILGKVNYNVSPEEKIDRYLFDLKKVIMQMGLSVTGNTDIEGLTADGAAFDGDVGVSGTATAQNLSASNQVSANSANISGQMTAGSAYVTGNMSAAEIESLGKLSIGGNAEISGSFRHKGSGLGFFSKASGSKQNVNKITILSPDIADLKYKINEVIGALQWYGLIGGN